MNIETIITEASNDRSNPSLWMGTSNLMAIAAVTRRVNALLGRDASAMVKRVLLQMHRDGELCLCKADMPQTMDQIVRTESEIEHRNGTFTFIRVR